MQPDSEPNDSSLRELERRATYVRWMLTVILMAALVGDVFAFQAYAWSHKAALEVEATRSRVDVGVGVTRELVHLAAPKADHFVCPAHDGRPEVDMGVAFPCPNPDDGMCARWNDQTLTASAADARCKAGKL